MNVIERIQDNFAKGFLENLCRFPNCRKNGPRGR